MEQDKYPKLNEGQHRLYTQVQIGLAMLMRSLGTVKDDDDYCKRVAPLFESLAFGEMYIAPDEEVDAMRQAVHDLIQL